MKTLVCCLLLSALTLNAAELAGQWSGSFEVTNASDETKDDTAFMELKTTAGEVTGTAGPNADQQWPLRRGKLDGEKLTFELAMDDGSLLVFDLKFDGESIRGTCAGTGHNGQKMSAKLELKKST